MSANAHMPAHLHLRPFLKTPCALSKRLSTAVTCARFVGWAGVSNLVHLSNVDGGQFSHVWMRAYVMIIKTSPSPSLSPFHAQTEEVIALAMAAAVWSCMQKKTAAAQELSNQLEHGPNFQPPSSACPVPDFVGANHAPLRGTLLHSHLQCCKANW